MNITQRAAVPMSHCGRRAVPALGLPSCALLVAFSLAASGCTEEGDTFLSEPGGGSDDVGDPPAPGDMDLDGLEDLLEYEGWNIAVDDVGYGPGASGDQLNIRRVTSDWRIADTDRDGLSDAEEFQFKADPRAADTDADLIGDREEVFRWRTSPVSVDTDGDARGPSHDLPPNSRLFDGSECEFLRTSPTLADTDGDNRTDFEEADDPLRSPLLSDLPQIAVDFQGEVDIRLFVAFEETDGRETEFESTLSTSRSTSDTTSTAVVTGGNSGLGGLLAGAGTNAGFAFGAANASINMLPFANQLCDLHSSLSGGTSFNDVDLSDTSHDSSFWYGLGVELLGPFGEGIEDRCAEDSPPTTTTTSSIVTSSTTETTRELERALHSMTETSSRGTVKVGARIRNDGTFAWELSDLFVTMSQWQTNPHPNSGMSGALGTGAFRTLATLRPVVDADIVLGPGETTPVLELAASDVNPAIIKGFLKHARAIFYSPAGFELSNAAGINFSFLTEETAGRTARVDIDFGAGPVESFVVATNVERYSLADEVACAADPLCDDVVEGALAGVRMGDLLAGIGIPYTTVTRMVENDAGELVSVQVLDAIDGQQNVYPDLPPNRMTGAPGDASRFWSVHLWTPQQRRSDLDFEDIVVEHGQSIRFVYVEDRDGDGLYGHEEDTGGAVDSPEDRFDNLTWEPGADGIPDSVDTDRDGLTDFEELKLGWRVCLELPGEAIPPLPHQLICLEDSCQPSPDVACYPADAPPPCYWVYSSPTLADSDGDGRSDLEENGRATDPNRADTDFDSASDAADPFPTKPATTFFVKADAPACDLTSPSCGTSWEVPFNDLYVALEQAKLRNGNAVEDDDVSQVWVAQGTYCPGFEGSFEIPKDVSVYGGFSGGESRRGGRDSNPLTNGTFLTGDTNGDDTQAWGNRSDNSLHVVRISEAGSTSLLDGFVISGGNAERAINSQEGPGEDQMGGGVLVTNGAVPTLSNLLFQLNQARVQGGALAIVGEDGDPSKGPTLQNCRFLQNRTFDPEGIDGLPAEEGRGGAVYLDSEGATVVDCQFTTNSCDPRNPGDSSYRTIGGALYAPNDSILVKGTVFARNRATWGGGLYLFGGRVEECSFLENVAVFAADHGGLGSGLLTSEHLFGLPSFGGFADELLVSQCVFWNNTITAGFGGALVGTEKTHLRGCTFAENSKAVDQYDVYPWDHGGGGVGTVENCILYSGGILPFAYADLAYSCVVNGPSGAGNITGSPMFVDAMAGNLRLLPGSPCIDAGNMIADFDPLLPGFQQAPEEDFGGKSRVADGDGDGEAVIDIGVFELQPLP